MLHATVYEGMGRIGNAVQVRRRLAEMDGPARAQRQVELAKTCSDAGMHAEAAAAAQEAVRSLEAALRSIAPTDRSAMQEVRVALADARTMLASSIFDLGDHQRAVDQLNALITALAADGLQDLHVPSLLLYSRVSHTYGKPQEAVTGVLKAISRDTENTKVRQAFSRVISGKGAMAELYVQVRSGPESAPALSLLGTACKEHSALEAATELFSRALTVRPAWCNAALSLSM